MRALLINTTFFAVAFALMWSITRALRDGDEGAKATWSGLRRFLSMPAVVTVLLVGAGLNTSFVVVAGYVDPLDFVQDEVAARQFLRHATLYPHDLPQQGIVELAAPITGRSVLARLPGIDRVLNALKDPPVEFNAHPPLLGILLALPVEMFGLRGSFLLLVLVSGVLLCWCVTAIVRDLFGPPSPELLAGLLGLVFGWYAVADSLRAAQPSILILTLISGSWLLLRRGRQWQAGVGIGVATCLHAFPAFLMLYLLLRSRRAFAASAATVCAISCAIGALAGFQTFKEWFDTIRATSNLFVPRLGNVSLAGLLATFSHAAGRDLRGDVAGPAMALTVAVIVGALLWPWNRNASDPSRLDREYAAAVVAMLLASPISWARYFPILLLPLAVIVRYRTGGGRWWAPTLLFALLLLSVPDSALGFWTNRIAPASGSMIAWLLVSIPSFGLIIVFLRTLQPGLNRATTR